MLDSKTKLGTDEDQSIEQWVLPIIASLIFILILVVAAALTGCISGQAPSLLLNGFGALGTLLLALATYVTVRQNRRSLKAVERDRLKPRAVDEIKLINRPARDVLSEHISKLDINWYSYAWYSYSEPDVRSAVGPENALKEDDEPTIRWIETQIPELYQKLKTHDELIHDICDQAGTVGEIIEPEVMKYIENSSFTDQISTITKTEDWPSDENKQEIMDAIIGMKTDFRPNHEYHDAWESHRERLIELIETYASEEYKELRSMVDRLLRLEKELDEELLEREDHLRSEYGISVEEIKHTDEEEVW